MPSISHKTHATALAVNGCDTIATTIHSYAPADPGYVYTLGCTAAETGISKDTLFGGAADGCDSITITVNSIRKRFPADSVSVVCGDSILIGGVYRTEEGTYHDTVQTAMGCDSIVPKTVSLIFPDKFYVDTAVAGMKNGSAPSKGCP